MFHDEAIKCRDCGNEFILSASEQEFFEAQGFESKPVRCKNCRDAHHGIRNKGFKGA
jgi:ssDNA-binding Zn-finger/Zn-ribbon topoisomerase 1